MSLFSLFARPTRPRPVTRARLGLEQLDVRATPSSFDVTVLASGSGLSDIGVIGTMPPGNPPGLGGPQIVNFGGAVQSSGWYIFTGTVLDASPGGLTVTFGGVPSLCGHSAVTAADGTFSLCVQVQTDGSDAGTVTAVTTDAAQLTSNTAWCDITPT